MSNKENKDFENAWQRSFEEASIPPPEALWEQIEAQLPTNKTLFWKSWKISLLGFGLLLFVGWLGFYFVNSASPVRSNLPNNTLAVALPVASSSSIVQNKKDNQPTFVVPVDLKSSTKTKNNQAHLEEITVSKSSSTINRNQVVNQENQDYKNLLSTNYISENYKNDSKKYIENNPKTEFLQNNITEKDNNVDKNTSYPQSSFSENSINQLTFYPTVKGNQNILYTTDNQSIIKENSLNNIPLMNVQKSQLIQVDFLKNIPLKASLINIRQNVPVSPSFSLPKAKPVVKEYWFGLSYQMGAFDPAVSATSSSTAYYVPTNGQAAAYNPSKNDTKSFVENTTNYPTHAGNLPSYSLSLKVGHNFSKHWFWETGITYLNGKSILNDYNFVEFANGVRTSTYTQRVSNQAIDASALYGYSSNANGIEIQNNFQFVSIPVKLGYIFTPEKNFNFTVAAGLSADLFLKNELTVLNDNTINSQVFTPENNVYKPLNTSLLLSAGVRYRLNKQISFSVEGNYQKAIFTEIKGDNSLQIKPSMVGVSIGSYFHF